MHIFSPQKTQIHNNCGHKGKTGNWLLKTVNQKISLTGFLSWREEKNTGEERREERTWFIPWCSFHMLLTRRGIQTYYGKELLGDFFFISLLGDYNQNNRNKRIKSCHIGSFHLQHTPFKLRRRCLACPAYISLNEEHY